MTVVRGRIIVLAASIVLAGIVVSDPAVRVDASHATDPVPCIDPRGCPDLVSDGARMNPTFRTRTFSATNCAVVEGMTEPGTRRLLQFTFTTPNVGAGDLIVGNPADHPEWFEFSACHGHYHFQQYADYRLWAPTQFATWNALRSAEPTKPAADVLAENPSLQPVIGEKRGFCVIDIRRYGIGIPKYLLCNFQGISVAWADEYDQSLDGQWVDVTGLPSGPMVLEEEVNAEHLYVESDYGNNRAWVDVTI